MYKTVAALNPIEESKTNHICIIQDISKRKQIEFERKYMAEHDKLTGLYNREYLVSLLEKHMKLKKKSKKALIGINLSMVQLLTANYGYLYVQNLIKKAAEVLKQYCTDNRFLFCPGENRFIYYLFDYKDKNELIDLSSAIAETLENLFITDRIGGGIGILEIEESQNEVDIDLLLRKLIIASEKSIGLFGKNFQICFYDKELEALVNRERDIVEALNIISAKDNAYKTTANDTYDNIGNDLFLQYQPIVDIKTGTILGFEALARLKTEKLGLVSPLEFIPIAEKTKLIIPVGEKVLAKTFGFLNKLKEYGYDKIIISVNVSVIQLLSPNFTSRLLGLINDMQVKSSNICIEITESVFASDYDNINNIIDELRNIGLHIAIDDFGTGYSSFGREKVLKVDSMKIDKYFIDNLLCTEPSKAITPISFL